MDEYYCYLLNKRATIIQDNTGTAGFVREPQLSLSAIGSAM